MPNEKESGVIEDIKYTEIKGEKFDPLNAEPITENLKNGGFTPPPPNSGAGQKPFEPIPEPKPNPQSGYGGQSSSYGAGMGQQGSNNGYQSVNPDLNDISEAEKQAAAEQAAEMIIAMYSGLKASAPKLFMVSQRKLKKMEEQGLINLTLRLQRSPNDPTPTSILEIVNNFNATASQGFIVSQEFKDMVKPVLTRVLKKKGVGLSDEQTLMLLFGQDIAQTAFSIFSGMRQRNEMLNQLKDIYAAVKATGGAATPAGSTQPAGAPPKQSASEPEERVSQDGFQNADVKTAPAGTGLKPDTILEGVKKSRKGRKRKAETVTPS